MFCSSKVRNTGELDRKENMLRLAHTACADKRFILERVSSLKAHANYTSVLKPAALPKLPVPKLNETLSKYLISIKPLLNDRQFAKTTSLVKDFENGVGPKLQAMLEKKAQQEANWLEDWWIRAAYLEYRDPVVVHSSPGLLLPYDAIKKPDVPVEYAAKLLLGSLDYKYKVDHDKFPQEMMGRHPLDMDQYRNIFGTCRIPWEKRDKLVYNRDSRHIIVLHNNHIFRLDLYGSDNVLLNYKQLVDQLRTIAQESPLHNQSGVGILTGEQRDVWAQAYQMLMENPKNHEYMKDIHESLIALCLDAPCGYLEAESYDVLRSRGGAQTIHGGGAKSNGGNRWYDKTIQIIIGAEGLAGMSYEHSPADGQPVAVLTNYLINFVDRFKDTAPPSKSPIPPKYLGFEVSTALEEMIREAERNIDALANNLFLHCFKFTKYGKNFIKAHRLSPDSFIQISFQFAFYRLHREPAAHYESASTRMFKGGRTETIRSCSIESVAFARAMLDASVSPADKIEALKKAIKAHKDYTVMALQGQGVDRHLLGLKLMSLESGITLHDMYNDVGFLKSTHMRISSSQVAFKSEAFMCYGPIVDDGYAVCYNPRKNDILFAVSTFKDDPDTYAFGFKEALDKSLEDMHDLLAKHSPAKL